MDLKMNIAVNKEVIFNKIIKRLSQPFIILPNSMCDLLHLDGLTDYFGNIYIKQL